MCDNFHNTTVKLLCCGNFSQHNTLKLLCCDSVWGKGGRCVPPYFQMFKDLRNRVVRDTSPGLVSSQWTTYTSKSHTALRSLEWAWATYRKHPLSVLWPRDRHHVTSKQSRSITLPEMSPRPCGIQGCRRCLSTILIGNHPLSIPFFIHLFFYSLYTLGYSFYG